MGGAGGSPGRMGGAEGRPGGWVELTVAREEWVELTIPAAVARAASEFGDAAAIAGPGGPALSYRELGERVTAVAGALTGAGVEPGDRVALWAPNGCHWVLAALGALGAGGVLVPVSTRFTGPEALDVISRSGARALFVAGDFLGVDRLGTLVSGRPAPAIWTGSGWWCGYRRNGTRSRRRVRWPRRAGGARERCGRGTSATSCSPRAPRGGARAR